MLPPIIHGEISAGRAPFVQSTQDKHSGRKSRIGTKALARQHLKPSRDTRPFDEIVDNDGCRKPATTSRA